MSNGAPKVMKLPVRRLTSMVFGCRDFEESRRLELEASSMAEWCCFSLRAKDRSYDFIADVASEARLAFMGAQLLRAGTRVPKATIGKLLWHVAKMRLHRQAVAANSSLKSALAGVMLAAARDRYGKLTTGSLRFSNGTADQVVAAGALVTYPPICLQLVTYPPTCLQLPASTSTASLSSASAPAAGSFPRHVLTADRKPPPDFRSHAPAVCVCVSADPERNRYAQ